MTFGLGMRSGGRSRRGLLNGFGSGRGGRRRQSSGGPSPAAVVGLAATVGQGWMGLRAWRGDATVEAPPARAAPLPDGPGGQGGPAPAPADADADHTDLDLPIAPPTLQPVSAGPAPAELVESFGRLASDDLMALVDLRRLAIEFAHTDEGQQAAQTLAGEQQRALKLARERSQQPVEALRQLTRAYAATLDAKTRRKLRTSVGPYAERVFFSGAEAYGTTLYTVSPGDVLARIARKHQTNYRFIKRLNGLKNDNIRVGQKLRIPQGPIQVVILKRGFELWLVYEGCLLKTYDIATGKDDKTPEGEFTIGTKLVKPDWYSPGGKVYKYGTPENILGTRWLAFVNTPEHQGFGIHGTKFPNSIGTEASMGCIRLRNHDVEELYDLVPSDSRVRIVR